MLRGHLDTAWSRNKPTCLIVSLFAVKGLIQKHAGLGFQVESLQLQSLVVQQLCHQPLNAMVWLEEEVVGAWTRV